jgi:hypothetical protein
MDAGSGTGFEQRPQVTEGGPPNVIPTFGFVGTRAKPPVGFSVGVGVGVGAGVGVGISPL